MIVELLCVALAGAALSQGTPVRNVLPAFEDDDAPIKINPGPLVIPNFEDDDDATVKKNPTNIVLPDFEDEDVNTGSSGGEQGNVSENAFLVVYVTPASIGEQTSAVQEVDNNGAEIPVDFVPQNTVDLPEAVTPVSATPSHEQNPGGLNGFFHILGNAFHEVAKENADNFSNGVDSILGVGQSVLHATNNIVDTKVKAIASIPRVSFKVFKALEDQSKS